MVKKSYFVVMVLYSIDSFLQAEVTHATITFCIPMSNSLMRQGCISHLINMIALFRGGFIFLSLPPMCFILHKHVSLLAYSSLSPHAACSLMI